MKIWSFSLSVLLALGTVPLTRAATTWVATSLHPEGAESSQLIDTDGAEQVGSVVMGGARHAALWRGTPESFVDLHPPTVDTSEASGVCNGEQTGRVLANGKVFAMTWRGTAESRRSLHPGDPAIQSSEALGTTGSQQCGWIGRGGVRAALWAGSFRFFVDLHPDGVSDSVAQSTNGSQQVGYVNVGGRFRAALWTGSRFSYRDLHPAGMTVSRALDIEETAKPDAQIVGYASVGALTSAALWTAANEGVVLLNPDEALTSVAHGTDGARQVGEARFGDSPHAALWSGTPESFVDLHDFLPADYLISGARAIWSDGERTFVAGSAYSESRDRIEAILWEEIVIPLPEITLKKRPTRATSRSGVLLRGTAMNAEGVEVMINGTAYRPVRGADIWQYRVRLRPGRNRVLLRAINRAGEASAPIRLVIHRIDRSRINPGDP